MKPKHDGFCIKLWWPQKFQVQWSAFWISCSVQCFQVHWISWWYWYLMIQGLNMVLELLLSLFLWVTKRKRWYFLHWSGFHDLSCARTLGSRSFLSTQFFFVGLKAQSKGTQLHPHWPRLWPLLRPLDLTQHLTYPSLPLLAFECLHKSQAEIFLYRATEKRKKITDPSEEFFYSRSILTKLFLSRPI